MILGQVVVKHGIHALDINATGSHIGGDENGISAALEPVHDLGALELFHIAVETCGRKATETQRLSQLVYHLLGVAEDHGRLGCFDSRSSWSASVLRPMGTLTENWAMASTVRCALWICTSTGSF